MFPSDFVASTSLDILQRYFLWSSGSCALLFGFDCHIFHVFCCSVSNKNSLNNLHVSSPCQDLRISLSGSTICLISLHILMFICFYCGKSVNFIVFPLPSLLIINDGTIPTGKIRFFRERMIMSVVIKTRSRFLAFKGNFCFQSTKITLQY